MMGSPLDEKITTLAKTVAESNIHEFLNFFKFHKPAHKGWSFSVFPHMRLVTIVGSKRSLTVGTLVSFVVMTMLRQFVGSPESLSTDFAHVFHGASVYLHVVHQVVVAHESFRAMWALKGFWLLVVNHPHVVL